MKQLISGRALYAEQDRVWVAQGMTFFAVDYTGKPVTRRYRVGGCKERLLSWNRISRQLLRQGLHHLVPLKNGSILVTAKEKTYILSEAGEVIHVFQGYRGNKPANQGLCVTPDGTIFFAEYTMNFARDHDTDLYRSTDNGMTFEKILTLGGKEVRHIHFVKYDPYENCLWLGTGDEDQENLLMRSDDNGDTWQTIGGGSQDWRAVGICFDSEALTWGTDAGSVPDQNHIVRMDRRTHQLETLADAEGPCHGCGSFRDGRVYISTGVEGGPNEADRFARMKQIRGKNVETVDKKEKDRFPLLMQYGVMRFPMGTEQTDRVVYTCFGLKGYGEVVCCEE